MTDDKQSRSSVPERLVSSKTQPQSPSDQGSKEHARSAAIYRKKIEELNRSHDRDIEKALSGR